MRRIALTDHAAREKIRDRGENIRRLKETFAQLALSKRYIRKYPDKGVFLYRAGEGQDQVDADGLQFT